MFLFRINSLAESDHYICFEPTLQIMKKCFLLFITILCTAATFGQTQHLIGLCGGVNVA